MTDVNEIKKIERLVMAYILNNHSIYTANIDVLNRDILTYDETARDIFSAFRELFTDGKKIDLITVSKKAKINILTVTELYQEVDYNIDFKTALSLIITNKTEVNLLRYLAESSKRLTTGHDVYHVLSDMKQFISDNEIIQVNRISPIGEHLVRLQQHMAELESGKINGIRTGLQKWDEHTGGLQASDLIVIAAETSQGKTSLALSIAYNAAINSAAKVAIFSLEMSELQLTARLAAIETKISGKKLLFQKLNRYESEDFNNRLNTLRTASIYIDDCNNSNIDYIVSGIKIAHMKHGIHVAVVDYLQLIKDGTKKSDESEIASNTRRLKNIAKELNITVILLSQLRREQNPKPTISRLRGSGQIEEAADLVVLLWRPEFYNIMQYEDSPLENTYGSAEVIIGKGRSYGTGKFWLSFEPKITYFSNIDYGTDRTIEPTF